MTQTYDLVVIGSGTAAQTAISRASEGRMAVIDHRPFAGTCALRGYDLKKCSSAARRRSTR